MTSVKLILCKAIRIPRYHGERSTDILTFNQRLPLIASINNCNIGVTNLPECKLPLADEIFFLVLSKNYYEIFHSDSLSYLSMEFKLLDTPSTKDSEGVFRINTCERLSRVFFSPSQKMYRSQIYLRYILFALRVFCEI